MDQSGGLRLLKEGENDRWIRHLQGNQLWDKASSVDAPYVDKICVGRAFQPEAAVRQAQSGGSVDLPHPYNRSLFGTSFQELIGPVSGTSLNIFGKGSKGNILPRQLRIPLLRDSECCDGWIVPSASIESREGCLIGSHFGRIQREECQLAFAGQMRRGSRLEER